MLGQIITVGVWLLSTAAAALCLYVFIDAGRTLAAYRMSFGNAQPTPRDVLAAIDHEMPERVNDKHVVEFWIPSLSVWVRFGTLPAIIGAYPDLGYRYLSSDQARRLQEALLAREAVGFPAQPTGALEP